MSAALLAGLLACAAAAGAPLDASKDDLSEKTLLDDTTTPPLIKADIKPERASGWLRQSASLLYYDEQGSLALELPLRSDEEPAGARVNVHEITGGAAPNGRFAWTLDRATTWNQSRTKTFASRRLLRVYGANGKELWSSSEADVPENGDPVQFSASGETLLVALRGAQGWTAAVKGYLGNTLVDVGPVPRLQLMHLTPSGRYAMVRWLVPDQSATHTFLETATKQRRDVPSSEFSISPARLTDEGKVYAGKRLVLDFAK